MRRLERVDRDNQLALAAELEELGTRLRLLRRQRPRRPDPSVQWDIDVVRVDVRLQGEQLQARVLGTGGRWGRRGWRVAPIAIFQSIGLRCELESVRLTRRILTDVDVRLRLLIPRLVSRRPER